MWTSFLTERFCQRAAWAAKQGIDAYRLYDREHKDFSLTIDWYNGAALLWFYPVQDGQRLDPDGPAQVTAQVGQALALGPDHLFIKQRFVQGSAQYQKSDPRGVIKVVAEQGLQFEVNVSDYVDTGLFLDHRLTRARVRELSKGKRVLNLFAYTGSFSCYARQGGAVETVTVDLSRPYCEWVARNFLLNGFKPDEQHRIQQDDVLTFLKFAAKKPQRYDLIICDPPTFSRGGHKRGKPFSLRRDYPHLIASCLTLLAPQGRLLFSTNAQPFKLEQSKLPTGAYVQDFTQDSIPEDFKPGVPHRCYWITKS